MGTQDSQAQELHKRFGERIKNLRIQKGWPQKTLAELSGMSVRSISQIERGEVDLPLSTIKPLADALHTTVSQILEGVA